MVIDSKGWQEGKAIEENYESKIFVLNGKAIVERIDGKDKPIEFNI
jgi:hypothetical protein